MATPALRIRIAPKFPTKQQAGVGLGVSRTGGTVTYRQDWSNVQDGITPPDDVEVLVRDPSDGQFYRTTPDGLADIIRPVASQAEAEAGSNNTKTMTPLRTKQSIDVNAELADFTPSLPATYTRPIGDRMREHRSAFDWINPSKHAAVRAHVLSGDLNTEIQAILDSGERRIFWPQGVYPVSLDGFSPTSTLAGIDYYGEGAGRSILSNVSLSSAARPLFISSGADAILRDLDFRVNTQGSSQPTMAAGQIAMGVGVLLMGDRVRADNLRVSDSWDNCIGVGKYDLTTGVQTDANPVGAIISNCVTYRGGSGTQTIVAGAPSPQPFNAGAGVNILCGSYANVLACTDFYSTQGFILDYAAGSSANFIGCYSYGARKTRVGSYASLDVTPGGQGFYIGSRGHIRDCVVYDSEGDGIWLDGYSYDCDVSVHVKGSQQRSGLIQGRNSRVIIQSEDASQRGSNLYDAVTLRGATATGIGVFTDSTGMSLDIRTRGTLHKYGLNVEQGPYTISGSLTPGSILTGVTGAVANTRPDLFPIHEYTGGAGGHSQAYGARILSTSNLSYVSSAFGDSGGNGSFILADIATPTKRLAMGYDPVNDLSVIQSMWAGIAKMPLGLNPSGGDVLAGLGSWNLGAFRLGAYYLWVDSSGRLRIKSSAPSSDTDGTIVGTQT